MEKNANPSEISVYGDKNFGKAKNRYFEDRIRHGVIHTRGGSIALGVVADGIGGENAGERAATLTVDGVFKYFEDSTESNIPEMLKQSLVQVNAEVFKESQQQSQKKNMGSTAVVAAIYNNRLYIANVGDSRIYLLRDGKLIQLTVDHTWEREVVQARKLSPAEAARHPRRDELVRSIGYEATVKVDLGIYLQGSSTSESDALQNQGMPLNPGDRIILCSDGLIKSKPGGNGHFVEPSEIIQIVTESSSSEAPAKLIQKALDRNVDDNVSVIVMEVPGGKRSLIVLPKMRLIAGVAAIALIVVFIGVAVLFPAIQPTPVLPTLPPVTGSQIYVAQLFNLSLNGISPTTGSLPSVNNGSFLKFELNETLQTSNGQGYAYAYLGFPGQAQVYLAGNTEITLKTISDTQFEILLNHGSILINKPGRRFSVDAPDGAQVWVSASMMGLKFDVSTQELYVDCLEDKCGVTGLDMSFPQGNHIVLQGNQVSSPAPGTHNEYWQFVPNLVATPTPTITPTATANSEATQACEYNKSLATPRPCAQP